MEKRKMQFLKNLNFTVQHGAQIVVNLMCLPGYKVTYWLFLQGIHEHHEDKQQL